jgi:hypothetical protein
VPKLALVVSLALFVSLLGCDQNGRVRVSDSDLSGSYSAYFRTGQEKLILHSDGRYEQIFSSSTRAFTNRGKWKSRYVLFEGTDVELSGANCSEDGPVVGDCSRNLNVHRAGRRLKLALNETADWYYEPAD